MTRDEIRAMPAGIEMDAVIAVKIMGFPIIELENSPCPYCGDDDMWHGRNRSRCTDCNRWIYSPYKNYSDDIADAWEVLEVLGEKEAALSYRGVFWFCNFGNQDNYEYSQAETAPLAISRAALLAVLT